LKPEAKRVLVVDDEHIIADTLAMIFSRSGYQARAVYSAEQATSVVADWHPDLAVIDVFLPGMNGVDLAILMKAEYPDCHILLFSGQTATSDLLEGARKAGHHFEVHAKPVPPVEILDIVSRLLGTSPPSDA
jgi:CheY-like chemotaxis protein